MERKEFIRRLGRTSLFIPFVIGGLSGCSKDDDPAGASKGSCNTTSSETAGPFPTKNPADLKQTDIRGDRTGVDLSIVITVLNRNNDCSPLENVTVDIWHCDKDGNYSEYGGTGMQNADFTSTHFLRGRQVTNAEGKV
jgi:protocatechuate 3,4-dioxygenase beta subunit